jgi:hypothetical protein
MSFGAKAAAPSTEENAFKLVFSSANERVPLEFGKCFSPEATAQVPP